MITDPSILCPRVVGQVVDNSQEVDHTGAAGESPRYIVTCSANHCSGRDTQAPFPFVFNFNQMSQFQSVMWVYSAATFGSKFLVLGKDDAGNDAAKMYEASLSGNSVNPSEDRPDLVGLVNMQCHTISTTHADTMMSVGSDNKLYRTDLNTGASAVIAELNCPRNFGVNYGETNVYCFTTRDGAESR